MAKDSFFDKTAAWVGRHPVASGFIAMFIVALVLLWAVLIFLNIWTHHGEDSTVPEIKELSYAEAQKILRQADLDIEISDSIYDTTIQPGTIIESWPKAGSQVKRGRKVYVTLTAFSPKHVTISQPIVGVSLRQAESYLNSLGINGIRIISVPSQFPDLVEGAHYNGRPLGVGSVIPIDAKVVLEVGYYSAPEEDENADGDGISAEDAIFEDLSGHPSYVDDSEL